MREQHGAELVGSDGERRPVAEAEVLEALEEAAVDEETVAALFEQKAGAGDRARGAEEGEVHGGKITRFGFGKARIPEEVPAAFFEFDGHRNSLHGLPCEEALSKDILISRCTRARPFRSTASRGNCGCPQGDPDTARERRRKHGEQA